MHFTDPVYRNPYWPTWPLIQITQGCTHNSCKFCTMYRDVPFRMQPMEWLEEDLKELQLNIVLAVNTHTILFNHCFDCQHVTLHFSGKQ